MNTTIQGSLQSRLLRMSVSALLFALLIFAAAATVAVDRTNRSMLDDDLKVTATSAASYLDVRRVHGRYILAPDRSDIFQMMLIIGKQSEGIAFDPAGFVSFSSTAMLPTGLLHLDLHTATFADLDRGGREVRAYVHPFMKDGQQIGTFIAWRSDAWIRAVDIGAALVFLAITIVMTLLAWTAGGTIMRRALDDAFARQRRFTADASHELRAPLSVIRAEADLALRRAREPEVYRAALTTIASEADRIERLLEDLLDAAQAESEHLPKNIVDVSQVVTDACKRIEATASAKSATIEVQSQKDISAYVNANAFEKALIAILHNAVKYVPEKGRVHVDVHLLAAGVEVAVRDDGPGFSTAALEYATERFWRNETGRTNDGTGLGLAIAKSIIESFGGSISLTNTPTGGAKVSIVLPAAG